MRATSILVALFLTALVVSAHVELMPGSRGYSSGTNDNSECGGSAFDTADQGNVVDMTSAVQVKINVVHGGGTLTAYFDEDWTADPSSSVFPLTSS